MLNQKQNLLRMIDGQMPEYVPVNAMMDPTKPPLFAGAMFFNPSILGDFRGPNGGYQLAKAPSECTVADILKQTEGSLAPIACLEYDPPGCERAAECQTLPVWKGLYKQITDYLEGITLQDILDHTAQNAPLNFVI